MTYGSATTSKDVPEFLRHVYHREPDPEVVAEFKRRFDLIGSSPLIEITIAQAKALQSELDEQFGDGSYLVEAGMLHSEPSIDHAVSRLIKGGCQKIRGLLLSPQYSSIIMGGYNRALEAAAAKYGFDGEVSVIGPWPDEPIVIKLLSDRLKESYVQLQDRYGRPVPIIFTTHSLPESVVKRDPSYLDQLQTTIDAVVRETGLSEDQWQAGYQSAGHTPEEWLKPDLKDLLADYHDVPAVLIVPIQFLTDHLEVLYDLDTAAREQAEEFGIDYHRIQLPNTDALLIRALADIIARQ